MSATTTPPLLIQYASDLHLEFLRPAQVDGLIDGVARLAPVIVLAGDVGDPFLASYARFVEAMSARFDWVVVIAGNHEFYGHAPEPTLARIAQVCREAGGGNVVFLHNQAWELPAGMLPPGSPRVRFFGGTMWSRIRDEERAEVAAVLNDFARIRGFGLAEYENEHWAFADLLEAELGRAAAAEASFACGSEATHASFACGSEATHASFACGSEATHGSTKLIVVSHYLPSYRLIHADYLGSRINSAFATDMAAADDPRIAAWFYGHTHKGRPGPRFFCNPLGYPGENAAPSCNRVAAIDLGASEEEA
jgi:SAM-dependent methyltransferase